MRRRRDQRIPVSHRVVPIVFVGALAAVGGAAAWHIYAASEMFAATFGTAAVGLGIAWLVRRSRWWWRIIVTAGTYVVIATLFSLRELLQDPAGAAGQVLRIVTAPVTGWKDILTLDLPLGNYQAVLAPYIAVVLTATVISMLLAWRGGLASGWAPAVAVWMPLFGLLFGSSVTELRVQMLIGIATFGLALAWLVWRARAARRLSLRRAPRDGARSTGARRTSLVRLFSGIVIAAVAVGVGVWVTPHALSGQTRDVLRTNVDPRIEIDRAVSPLSTFRNYRTTDLLDTTLFSVSAPQSVTRVRLATLGAYDGIAMRPGGVETNEEATEFRRVPSALPNTTDGDPVTVTVTMDSYADMWVPIAGDLVSAEFEGSRRAALADGFFYQRSSQTGVQLAGGGLAAGDQLVTQVVPADSSGIAEFMPGRTGGSVDPDLVPQSLTAWMGEQGVTLTGEGLAALIERLRERGYVSHSIVNDESSARWMDAFDVEVFEPSRAGHTTARIDRLFSDLVTREQDAGSGAQPEDLVAAIGDDEQFAVAAFLMADSMGFDARVALGVTLDAGHEGVPSCELGVCTGKNVTAWLEVRDATTGEWGILDVTPQHQIPPHAETTQRSEPQHHTPVDSRHGDTVPPPDAAPNEGGVPPEEDGDTSGLWALIWPALRLTLIGLLVLLVLATPALVVLGLKRWNTRARVRAARPRQRLVGGWDEFVDRAVDHGAPYPRSETRLEYAGFVHADPETATELARIADRASFSTAQVTDAESAAYWELVHGAHATMRQSATRWARFRSRLSLRSLRVAMRREVRRQDGAV